MVVKVKRKLFMEPTENEWESRAVLNPTIYQEDKTEHMFYRAVSKNWVSSIGYAKINKGKIKVKVAATSADQGKNPYKNKIFSPAIPAFI